MTSIQETTSGALVKSDRAGRTRYTKTYKAEVIAAYEQSGMTAAAFAGKRLTKHHLTTHSHKRRISSTYDVYDYGCLVRRLLLKCRA